MRTERLTHTGLRISSQEFVGRSPVAGLTLDDMPPLSRNSNQAPFRKQSFDSDESFDFSEINRRMDRMDGEFFTPDTSVELQL